MDEFDHEAVEEAFHGRVVVATGGSALGGFCRRRDELPAVRFRCVSTAAIAMTDEAVRQAPAPGRPRSAPPEPVRCPCGSRVERATSVRNERSARRQVSASFAGCPMGDLGQLAAGRRMRGMSHEAGWPLRRDADRLFGTSCSPRVRSTSRVSCRRRDTSGSAG
jgi:ribosomal protein S6E (S10)